MMKQVLEFLKMNYNQKNKLAKARKTRKSPGSLGLKKKFCLGKFWVKKVWAQNIFIDFLAKLDNAKIFFGQTPHPL